MKNPQPHAFDDRGLALNGERHPTDHPLYERPLVEYPGDFQIVGDDLLDWQGNVLNPEHRHPISGEPTRKTAREALAERAGANNTVVHDGELKYVRDLPEGEG